MAQYQPPRSHSTGAAPISNAQGATVQIDVVSPIDEPGDGWILTAVPPGEAPAAGPATVVDAELTGAPRHVRWRWSTLMWTPGVLQSEEIHQEL